MRFVFLASSVVTSKLALVVDFYLLYDVTLRVTDGSLQTEAEVGVLLMPTFIQET